MKPLITIFILLYNNVSELEPTVASILEQDYDNAEIIISDDGSTKYDTGILEKYAKRLRARYASVRVNVNLENVGTVKHLNKVFRLANGKYMFSCCSGDRYASRDTISKLVAYFEKSGALLVTTRRIDEYDNKKTKVRPSRLVGAALRLCPMKLRDYMLAKKNLISGCCTFYSKALFEQYGYLDERYHLVEDYPLYIKLLTKGVRIYWYGIETVIHGIGGVSTGRIHPSIYKDIELLRSEYNSN